MPHTEGIGISVIEIGQELLRTSKGIGDLQRSAEQHREGEEHQHLRAPEQRMHRARARRCWLSMAGRRGTSAS